MTEHPDYETLRELVLRYGAEHVIKVVRQIAVHEPKQPDLMPLAREIEKRIKAQMERNATTKL